MPILTMDPFFNLLYLNLINLKISSVNLPICFDFLHHKDALQFVFNFLLINKFILKFTQIDTLQAGGRRDSYKQKPSPRDIALPFEGDGLFRRTIQRIDGHSQSSRQTDRLVEQSGFSSLSAFSIKATAQPTKWMEVMRFKSTDKLLLLWSAYR